MKETGSTEETYDGEIDLNSIFAVLWKRRKLILFGTLGATLLSIGISLILPRVYRSEGFYQLGNPTKNIAENEKSIIKKDSIHWCSGASIQEQLYAVFQSQPFSTYSQSG
jgi:hypothetical protein